jgi:hypothetical protein
MAVELDFWRYDANYRSRMSLDDGGAEGKSKAEKRQKRENAKTQLDEIHYKIPMITIKEAITKRINRLY